jgi:hypothetical protein
MNNFFFNNLWGVNYFLFTMLLLILQDAKSSQAKQRHVLQSKIDIFWSHFSILANDFKNDFHRSETEVLLKKGHFTLKNSSFKF